MIFDICTRPSALTTPPTVTQPPAPHSPARSPPKKPSLRKTWDSPADSFLPPPQALAREGRSHSKKSSRRGSTTKDQTLAEPLVLEVRDRARADENTPAPARNPSPRSPRPPVSPASSGLLLLLSPPVLAFICVLNVPRPFLIPYRPIADRTRPRRRSTPGRRRKNSANECL